MAISEVYNEDCMDYMRNIPDKFFDLAIVDPPYGIGEDWKKRNNGINSRIHPIRIAPSRMRHTSMS